MKPRTCLGLVIVLVSAVAMAGPCAAAAPTAASAVENATTTQRKVVRGTFTQRKYLAELEQPLISSGRYVVAAAQGLIWQITQPIQAQLVISRQHLIRRSNGRELTRINVDEQPALQIVAAVLLAVFQADTAQLRQYFEIEKDNRDNGRWTMTLRPKSAAVAEFIDHVSVRGATDISQIELYQPGGDRTVIELQPASGGSDTLSASERAEFLQ